MSEENQDENPMEALVDLLVYAPVGLLYEYQDVLPQLVRRGKSQVQLARLMATMAARQAGDRASGSGASRPGPDAALAAFAAAIAEVANGALATLTNPGGSSTRSTPRSAVDQPEPALGRADNADSEARPDPGPPPSSDPDPRFPIEDYDSLTAREIVALLGDLDTDELDRIKDHESTNRGRKTILGKIDRLAR